MLTAGFVKAQTPLITNIPQAYHRSLTANGNILCDPYETGFTIIVLKSGNEKDREAYWNSDIPDNKNGSEGTWIHWINTH